MDRVVNCIDMVDMGDGVGLESYKLENSLIVQGLLIEKVFPSLVQPH